MPKTVFIPEMVMWVAILDRPLFIMRKLDYFKNIKLSQIGYTFVSKLCKQGQQNTVLQVKFFLIQLPYFTPFIGTNPHSLTITESSFTDSTEVF